MKVMVTGAGGFVGGHLCDKLKKLGYYVIGIDRKRPEFRPASSIMDVLELCDLRDASSVRYIINRHRPERIYALAADMGGMGFISNMYAEADLFRNNLLMNINTIHMAVDYDVQRYFFSSSVCVYPKGNLEVENPNMDEDTAFPADPGEAYGWEKLTTERLLRAYEMQYGIDVRILRFHNVYGPYGTWRGGREKAPAALCRKVATAVLRGDKSIDVWGDGKTTRPFLYVDDCVEGILRYTDSHVKETLNLGPQAAYTMTVEELAYTIMEVAHAPHLEINWVLGPQGHRHRSSHTNNLKLLLDWEPQTLPMSGLAQTYHWIFKEVERYEKTN